jgi:hypothetical protein
LDECQVGDEDEADEAGDDDGEQKGVSLLALLTPLPWL